MSTLWTPSGEHPVDREQGPGGGAPPPPRRDPAPPPGVAEGEPAVDVEELRRQLAETPAEVVVANHAYGLFELAAVYLSQQPPLLDQARLAIDAMGAVVEALGPRLGEAESQLRDGLAQLRLAYVQLTKAETPPTNGAGGEPG